MSDRRRTIKAQADPSVEPEGAGAPHAVDPVAEPAAAFRARGRGRGRRAADQETDAETGQRPRPAKPHAPLVAQLIATELNLEQTRVRRRGSAKDAAALYGRKSERAKPTRGEA